MAWARLDDGWHDHPKTIAAGLDGAGLWAMCLTWAHKTRKTSRHPGVIPDEVVARFAGTKAKKLATKLRDVEYFDDHTPHGWPIHDFDQYLPRYDSEQAAINGSKGGRAKAKRTASKPPSDSPSKPPSEAVANGVAEGVAESSPRADTGASARRNPVPVPVVNSSPSVISRNADEDQELTDGLEEIDYEDLARRLRPHIGVVDPTWARKIADQVLSGARGGVGNPIGYVVTAVARKPGDYRQGSGPPSLREMCDHGQRSGSCPHCRRGSP